MQLRILYVAMCKIKNVCLFVGDVMLWQQQGEQNSQHVRNMHPIVYVHVRTYICMYVCMHACLNFVHC